MLRLFWTYLHDRPTNKCSYLNRKHSKGIAGETVPVCLGLANPLRANAWGPVFGFESVGRDFRPSDFPSARMFP